jgi:membrane carboxypeptidase/penicillin-binding protein PbpC
MNKLGLKIFKVFKIIILSIIIIFLLLYFSLWFYTYISVPKELKIKYSQNIESNLSDEQYNIILFYFNGNKNHRIKNYPFIVDMIIYFMKAMKDLEDKSYYTIPTRTAEVIYWDYFENSIRNNRTLKGVIIQYGFVRHIVAKYDYKKCINIIMKSIWMGENIFGLENACMEYYRKTITDITNEELISLLVLTRGSQMYKLNSERNINKTAEIMNKYKLTN